MSSFADCIGAALADKKFGPKKQEEILEKFEGLRDEYLKDGYSKADAERLAANEAVARHEIEIKERKKRQLAHAMKSLSIDQRLDEYKNPKELWEAANAFIERDNQAPWLDYGNMVDRIRGQGHGLLASLIEKYRPRIAGLRRPKAGQENVVREIFKPGSTGDATSAGFAKAWTDTVDFMVRRFNAAGGTLMRRTDWNLPQKQSRFALAKAGKARWVQDHMDWLDWDAMRDPSTGRRIPLDKREEVLGDVFDTLKTNGHIKRKVNQIAGPSVGNKLDQSRFLVYKDGDAWLSMHRAYGDGNVYNVMMTHVDTMAHQIALVETFGPNPTLMRDIIKSKILKRLAQRDAKGDTMLSAKAEDKLRAFDDMFSVINRETKLPEVNHLGHFMAGTRNILTSAFLGSASLLAIPGDIALTALTNTFNRTPVFRSLHRYVKLMNPLSSADRKLAIRSNLIAENATRMAYAQTRIMGIETYGPMITRLFSDIVMRLSLLSPHTEAARWAFSMEFMGAMADNAGVAFRDLPFREAMERVGITEADWNTFRSIQPHTERGATFLRPDDLYKSGMNVREAEKVADKFMIMIIGESKFAVPDASIRGLTLLRGNTRSGTLIGEIANSFAMFKNFVVTILFTHMRRGLDRPTLTGKASYIMGFMGAMTAAGALGLQLRQIAQGKDPLDMTDPLFTANAALAGGGLGIWGDFLFSDVNRFGGGLTDTAAGPVVPVISDVRDLTIGNVKNYIEGKNTNAPAELVQFAKRVTPGTSIWWNRLVTERLLWDQLQRAVDPKAHSKWRRRETLAKKTHGQKFWWRPGRTEPERAPNLGAALP